MELITGIDVSILLFIQNYIRNDFLTPIMKGISFLGNAGWFGLALCVLLIIRRKTRKAGITAFVSIAITFILYYLLNHLICRPRPFVAYPEITRLIPAPHGYSCPSGHTANSFAYALVLVRMLDKRAGVPLVILAVLIGLSRLYLGVHYPTDVIFGFLLALIVSQIVYFCSKKTGKNEKFC